MNKLQTIKQEKPSHKQNIRAFTIYADMTNADLTWERYGHVTAPQVVKYSDGTFELKSRQKKIWIKENEYKDTISKVQSLLPNEHIDHIVSKEVDLKKIGLELHNRYESHRGDTVHWTFLSKEKFTIEDSDNVQIGCVIRNGMNTNVSLGIDMYTMRLVCTNGAIARGRNLGSFSMAHIGKIEIITKKFEDQLKLAVKHSEDLIKYYKRATKIKVNNDIANAIYKRMLSSNTYLPDHWHIRKHKEIRELRKEGKLKEANDLVTVGNDKMSLWSTFNEITEKHRDGINNKDIRFSAVAKQQSNLHRALIEVVNQYKN